MKRILIAIIVSILAFAQNANATATSVSPAVEMVSYEQTWLDNEGTIALKNNTSEEIHNVSFTLEYLDMQGNQLDYETYSYNIDIAPGMTKKLDIPAYESDRQYHYYKNKDQFGHPAFKLRYELKEYNHNAEAYNQSAEVAESANIDSSNDSLKLPHYGWSSILMIMFLLGILGVYVGMYVLVAVMAQRRNRNPVIWLLLSFIATPFLICIILLALGHNYRDDC